jgi:hypothetical protein
MFKYTDTCTVERADKTSMSITKFIVGCGLPFNIINSVFFIDMITDLNVVYAEKYLPKQKTFKLKWLPELFNDTFETVASYFRLHPGVLRTMGLDGYTTSAGHHEHEYCQVHSSTCTILRSLSDRKHTFHTVSSKVRTCCR